MKKLFPYLLIFAFLLQIANAETLLYSGKVITDTDKEISGSIFRFRYDETANKAFAQTPSTNLIVDNGACKSNNVFKVCLNKANFSYKNITTYVYYYELDVAIYKLTGSLSAASKAVQSTLLQNEQAEFTITITNPTAFEITRIDYAQDLSPFYVKEANGCSLDQGKLSWQGSLKSGYDKTCTAIIIAAKGGTFSLVGNLSYFNSYETEKKTTGTLQVKVLPRQLSISKRMDNVTEVKQPFFINMSLQNTNKDEKMEAIVTIELPVNLVLLKELQGFSKDSNFLRRTLILEPGSIFNYSMYLEASKEGTAPLRQTFDYTLKNVGDVIENETFFNAAEPIPAINFTASNGELVPGQEFIVFVKLNNPGKFHELKDFKARLTAPYNGEIVQTLGSLAPDESSYIISNTLVLPKSLAAMNRLRIDLELSYDFLGAVRRLNRSIELDVLQHTANDTSSTGQPKENTSQNMLKTNQSITTVSAEKSAVQNLSKEASSAEEIRELSIDKDFISDLYAKPLLAGVLIFMGVLILAVCALMVGVAVKIRKELKSGKTNAVIAVQAAPVQPTDKKEKLSKKKILIILTLSLLLLIAGTAFLVSKLATKEQAKKFTAAKNLSENTFVAAEMHKEVTLTNKILLGSLIFIIILGIPFAIYSIGKMRKPKG